MGGYLYFVKRDFCHNSALSWLKVSKESVRDKPNECKPYLYIVEFKPILRPI